MSAADDFKKAAEAAKQASRAYEGAKESLELLGRDAKITLAQLEKLREEHHKAQDALKEANKEMQKYNTNLSAMNSNIEKIAPGFSKLTEALERTEDGFKGLEVSADSFISGMISMAATIEETNVALAKQTGFATALQQDVIDLASSHEGLYLTMSESAEIVGALSTGFKMYNAQNKQTRKEVNDLAGRFKVLGVDANAFASVLDQLNEGFGLTGAGAIAAAAELENLAIRTGSPLASVVNDFQDLGPQMSRFGSDGVRVFSRLSEQARTLGLTTRQAFDFSELFDTFESSADVAGKLNAQLGLQLNSVELMAASSEDRLSILRAEFDMEGMRFDQMSRRQRQMVAEILQTDVLSAERLLGDPMELRKFQREQENNAERVQKFTTSMDKFRAVAEQLFINLSPLLMGIMGVVNKIAEGINFITSGPLGKVVSSFLVLGSIVLKLGSSIGKMFGYITSFVSKFPMLTKFLGFVGTVAKRLIVPFLLAKDVLQSLGLFVDNKEEQAAAQARLAGGLGGAGVGAIAGGGIGSLPAAFIGYGVGREVTNFANDKVQTGPAIISSPQGTTRLAAGDTIVASRDGSELSQLVKGVNELIRVTKESRGGGQEAVLNVDGKEFARAMYKHVDPVATV